MTSRPSDPTSASEKSTGCPSQEEPSARAQERCDHLRPAADVRQPAERADAREGEIKQTATEHLRGEINVGFVKVDLCRREFGEAARLDERSRREIEPAHARAEPGERDRIRPDMALQMDAADPDDRPEPRQVKGHHLAEVAGIGR